MQDKRWLGEAVINVLDNAVKYSPGGSKIFIRLQKRNDLVRMEIEDQGSPPIDASNSTSHVRNPGTDIFRIVLGG